MSRYKVKLLKENFNDILGLEVEILDATTYGIMVEKCFKNRDSISLYDDIVFMNDSAGVDENRFTEVAKKMFTTGKVSLSVYTDIIKAIAKKYA